MYHVAVNDEGVFCRNQAATEDHGSTKRIFWTRISIASKNGDFKNVSLSGLD
jgi:hypothetical protein